jgi:hypothetical protein
LFKDDLGEYKDRQFALMAWTPKEGPYKDQKMYCWAQLANRTIIPVGRMHDSIPPRPSGAARLYPRATRDEWMKALTALETVSGQQKVARELQPEHDRVNSLSPTARVDKMMANVTEAECLSLHGMNLQEYKVKMVTRFEKDEKDKRDTNRRAEIKRRRALRDPVAREKMEKMQDCLKEMLRTDFIVPFGKSAAMMRRVE